MADAVPYLFPQFLHADFCHCFEHGLGRLPRRASASRPCLQGRRQQPGRAYPQTGQSALWAPGARTIDRCAGRAGLSLGPQGCDRQLWWPASWPAQRRVWKQRLTPPPRKLSTTPTPTPAPTPTPGLPHPHPHPSPHTYTYMYLHMDACMQVRMYTRQLVASRRVLLPAVDRRPRRVLDARFAHRLWPPAQ